MGRWYSGMRFPKCFALVDTGGTFCHRARPRSRPPAPGRLRMHVPHHPFRRRALTVAAAGAAVALVTGLLVAVASNADAATLFSDNFEDGNANGWSKTNGSWSVVSDGSYVYRQGSTGADARAIAGAGSGAGTTVSARVK